MNDKLQDLGQVNISDLIKQYDLPADFVQDLISARLGSVIQGRADEFDSRVIFTESFISRHRACIYGALSAVTRPVTVQSLINHYHFHERLFFSIVQDLCQAGELPGSMSGGRSEQAVYMPDVYAKAQSDYVESFYKQNGYLEYDSLNRLGISDPKKYAKKLLKNDNLLFLSTCCCGAPLEDQIEAAIEEALSTEAWVDVMPLLPSVFSKSDAVQILQRCLKKLGQGNFVVCADSIIVSAAFVEKCSKYFDELMVTKAEQAATTKSILVTEGAAQEKKSKMVTEVSEAQTGKQGRKEERRQKAVGGAKGGGAQGRETKTKSLKKKGGRGRMEDEEEESTVKKNRKQELEFLSVDELEEILQEKLQNADCPEELIADVARQIYRPLTQKYQEIVRSVFLASFAKESVSRRKAHDQLTEKVNGLVSNIRLFEKGLALFSEDVQVQLTKHLLKTICTDVVHLIIAYLVAEEGGAVDDEKAITAERRTQFMSNVEDPVTKAQVNLIVSDLGGSSLENFHNHLEAILELCQVLVRKMDKKKEK